MVGNITKKRTVALKMFTQKNLTDREQEMVKPGLTKVTCACIYRLYDHLHRTEGSSSRKLKTGSNYTFVWLGK